MNHRIKIIIIVLIQISVSGYSILSGQQTVAGDTIPHFRQVESLSFKPDFIFSKNQLIVPKYTHQTLPFFCKMEHIIESNSKIALRFRLGDLNYVNMLENKR